MLDRLLAKRRAWSARQNALSNAIWFMLCLLAVPRLTYQFWRLLFDQSYLGAIDLKNLHTWGRSWFAGEPLARAHYPPASFAILWPFTGWLSFEWTRRLWAVLFVACLVWLAHIVITGTGSVTRRGRWLAVLFVLAIAPTGGTIGNGQLILLLLPCALAAVLMQEGAPFGGRLGRDLVVALLLVLLSVKVTVAAPLLLVPLFTQRRFRALMLAAGGYVALTFLAMAYRQESLREFLQLWLEQSRVIVTTRGYGHLHGWLSTIGLSQLIVPMSIALLAAFSVWLHRHRAIDIWVPLGAAAIVARVWAYHNPYDDLLILVPLVTLVRIVGLEALSPSTRLTGELLLLAGALGLLAPGFLFWIPNAAGLVFRVGHAAIWLAILVFLVRHSTLGRERAVATS